MPQLHHFRIHRFVNSTLWSAEIQYTRIRRRGRIVISVNRIFTLIFRFIYWKFTFFFFIMEISIISVEIQKILSFHSNSIYFQILDNQGLRMDVQKNFSYLETKMVEEITRLNAHMIRILNYFTFWNSILKLIYSWNEFKGLISGGVRSECKNANRGLFIKLQAIEVRVR